ncbi:MucR family transcriptional regulator [Methylobacterium oryzisoli]|uniref:MucR family transcriptional regulator n=1 Tax=Methylobacterium oryzisoli TaxID=3385502 RepID=UPI003891CD8D
MTEPSRSHTEILDLTVGIVSAFASHNTLQPEDLTKLISDVFSAMRDAGREKTARVQPVTKASASEIRRSITREALISFEDGKPCKTLRRHLTQKGLTPATYRAKWGLPPDYPMTSPAYSEQRSQLARSLGLGQQRRRRKPDGASDET